MSVVVLAGGTGGAKLARGMLEVVGDELVVIANTGDDVELYNAYVSPDPDLVSFWLADRIDARGWGLEGDTFNVMNGLRALGRDIWFNLGDEDLAVGLERARIIAEGGRLTDALAALTASLGLRARVVPMSDAPVRTRVKAADRWWDFQEFMIRHGGAGPIQDMVLDGIEAATPPAEALEAIAGARAIIVGPSNPVISIGPILAVPGMRDALSQASAPVVAVSPIVGGSVVKGPTEPFLAWTGRDLSASGVADLYGDVLDGIVTDEQVSGLGVPALTADTMMADAAGRERVARVSLEFALGLAS